MDAYKKSLGLAEQAISTPYQQYQGQLVAGLNPTQLQGISNVNAAQGAALPYLQQAGQYTQQAAQGVTPGMINQYMSPYLENVVNATQRNLLESNAQQQAAMKGSAIQSGAFGGDRARFAQAELARQQGLAGGQVISGLYNQGYGQALAASQNQLQNLLASGAQYGNLGMSAQQSILQGAQAQMAAGAQQQATEQSQLQAAYDQFLQRQAYPYQQAQFYANIAQGIGAGAGGTTAQTPAQPSFLSQLFGGVAAIGSIWPSDERLKENIEPIGKTFDGQNIYKYNFKGDDRKQIGLIAQEVEHKHPEAVRTLGDIKMVDYDEATQDAAHGAHKALGGASMGGVVHPGLERQAFAQGGFGSLPYADFMRGLSWIPTGELTYKGHSPGSTLPEGYKMSDLEKIAEGDSLASPDFLDPDRIDAFKAGLGKLKAGATKAYGYVQPEEVDPTGTSQAVAAMHMSPTWNRGGLVRHAYGTGGVAPEDDTEPGLAPELIQSESGGDLGAISPSGAIGRGQFMPSRLADAKAAGVIPGDMSNEDFLKSEGLQRAAERWQAKDIGQFIQDRGLDSFVGQDIKGVPVTPAGLQAVAHLGGKHGLEKFLKSGGEYNPHDANGTSLMDYLSLGAKSGPQAKATGVVAPAADTAPEEGGSFLPAIGDSKRSIIENILGRKLSPQANAGILAAGLAMLGGRSPYAGVNIGRGALTGLETYYKGLASDRETMKAQAEAASQFATAGKTAGETSGIALGQLRMLQQLYLQGQALADLRNEKFPSWEQFLSQQGFSGRGWEDIKPTFTPSENAPAEGGETDTGASGAETSTGAEEPAAADTGEPAPAATEENKAPSDLVHASNTNYNFKNVLPQENPYILRMGSPDDQAKADAILQSGKVMDRNGNLITFRGGDQIAAESKAVADLNNNFKETQAQIPQMKNAVDKLADVLESNGSNSLTTIRGQVGNLLVGLGWGSEEDVQNATASDLLTKLYKQLSLMSPLQGAASTAGIDKIKQVESGSGSPVLIGAAAREIVGNLRGVTNWQNDMVKDWGKLVQKYSNTGISEPMRNEWMSMWNDKLPQYSEQGMATTPVKDPTLWQPNDKGIVPMNRFHTGWQYVMPDGSIGVFTGKKDEKYFKKVAQ